MNATSFRRVIRAGSFRRYLVLLVLIPLGYLCHVCIMPYLHGPLGVTPNLLYAIIAIVTVAYGRLQAFWVGLIYGLLLEILLPSVTYLNLGIYSITSLFVSFPFADRSLQRLEMDRALNRRSREMPAWLRTVLCAAVNVFFYEVINIAYIYLDGSPITVTHFMRSLADVGLTALLTLLILIPVRRLIFGKKVETRVLKSEPVRFSRK